MSITYKKNSENLVWKIVFRFYMCLKIYQKIYLRFTFSAVANKQDA